MRSLKDRGSEAALLTISSLSGGVETTDMVGVLDREIDMFQDEPKVSSSPCFTYFTCLTLGERKIRKLRYSGVPCCGKAPVGQACRLPDNDYT